MESEEITSHLAEIIVTALKENRPISDEEKFDCTRLINMALVLP